VWERWGLMYRAKNDLRRAEHWFRKALAAERNTRRHVFVGATLAKQGRHVEALAEHRAAIALNSPGDPVDEAHLNAALVLRGLGRYKEARVHLKKAIRLDPKYKDAFVALRDIERVLSKPKKAPR
jgi:tetratricopeptide (TPR) repeat protein